MAEEEAQQPLAFVAETVLKKRKSTEALALTRKAQLEFGKSGQKNKKSKVEDIKRPEEFIKQYRDQVNFNFYYFILFVSFVSIVGLVIRLLMMFRVLFESW